MKKGNLKGIMGIVSAVIGTIVIMWSMAAPAAYMGINALYTMFIPLELVLGGYGNFSTIEY